MMISNAIIFYDKVWWGSMANHCLCVWRMGGLSPRDGGVVSTRRLHLLSTPHDADAWFNQLQFSYKTLKLGNLIYHFFKVYHSTIPPIQDTPLYKTKKKQIYTFVESSDLSRLQLSGYWWHRGLLSWQPAVPLVTTKLASSWFPILGPVVWTKCPHFCKRLFTCILSKENFLSSIQIYRWCVVDNNRPFLPDSIVVSRSP